MPGLLESNVNAPLQTTGFRILYNQSSLEEKMNEPIFSIKVPAVRGRKEVKETGQVTREK